MTPEDVNAQSWRHYGQRQLERGYMPPIPQQIAWGPWDGVGPGDAALGHVVGKRLLDIGSGAGHHAVHLAQRYGARIDAIELSPTQHERAVTHHGHIDGVAFLLGDMVTHLHQAQPYEGAYAIGSLPYLDPTRSLPALRDGLLPGAPLVFSALHTNLHGTPPLTSLMPRQEMIQLRDTEPIPVNLWVLTSQLWEALLTEHDFTVEAVELLTAPDPQSQVVHQLITARRKCHSTRRVTSRPRSSTPPPAHAALGVGAIVHGPRGILLGRHRKGTWELPGGSVEAGESLKEAVVRELAEESGLHAEPHNVRLLGTLLDHVQGVVRITVASVVETWHGEPADQPDESVGSWQWCPLDRLPHGLFDCSSQILTTWRPDLPIDHPPADFTPFATHENSPAQEAEAQ